ncbi:MAG: hypothetical protein M3442_22170 [Chloroflexota bacterium]|nr:hypothetical protein [Chloroflexota bacterium]
MTHLTYGADGSYADQAMTGVRRAYRGRKVAQGIGLVPALLVGAAGRFLALLWLALSPVRTVRE